MRLLIGVMVMLALQAMPAAAESRPDLVNPEGLFRPATFSQIAVFPAGRTAYISGQTARDGNAKIVGAGDVRAQADKVFDNLRIAVESVGGSMASVGKITTYVVNLQPDDRVWIGEMVKKYFPRPPAHTLVGISALAVPELLIEVEAFAVLD